MITNEQQYIWMAIENREFEALKTVIDINLDTKNGINDVLCTINEIEE